MTSDCDQVRDGGIGQNDLHAPPLRSSERPTAARILSNASLSSVTRPAAGSAMPRSKAAFNVLSFSSRSDEQDEVARVMLRLVGA